MLIAVFFVIAKKSEIAQLFLNKWMVKLRYIHTMKY